MKTKECPSCAMEINADSKVCPICNYEFPKTSPVLKWVAVALILLFILLLLL
ncbi:MAG: hypothetical protein L0Y35_01535 [Flammeovirgaceae bacterium]|nr:hypothetical protein [Flammeovirgaceae bacterium]